MAGLVPQFGSPTGQGNAAAISVDANDPAQNLLPRNGFVAREGGIALQPEYPCVPCGDFDNSMGDQTPFGAVEDDVCELHMRGSNRLHRDDLSLSDAGIHASPTGPEAHSGALAQKLCGEIQK